MVRVFVSIDIPERVQEEIKKIQDALPGFDGRKTEPENLHLTLKFLGEIDEEILIEIKRRLKEIKSNKIETKIDEIGVFSPRRIRIIWLHMTGCAELQKEIDRKLAGIFPYENRFMSHLTIARARKVKNKNYFLGQLKKIKIPANLKFKIDKFRLKKSTLAPEGPVYEILDEYSLK